MWVVWAFAVLLVLFIVIVGFLFWNLSIEPTTKKIKNMFILCIDGFHMVASCYMIWIWGWNLERGVGEVEPSCSFDCLIQCGELRQLVLMKQGQVQETV